MQDSYKIKEIIFGQREEYIKLQRDLEFLRELCGTNDENIKDFKFVFSNVNNENNIYCKFITEPKNIKGIFIELLKLFKEDINYGKCLKEENVYQIVSKYYSAFIKPEYMNKFNKVYKEIMTSDFINTSNFGYKLCNSYLHHIYTSPTFIDIGFDEVGRRIRYDVKRDGLIIEMPDIISSTLIKEFFDYEISKDMFTDYQRKTIESSSALNKEFIYLLEDNQDKKVNLSVRDGVSGNITLKKVKI